MDKNTWPSNVCNLDYPLNIPTRIPTVFSIVVMGIPAQWGILELESDIKKQYPTVLKVERLFAKGRVPTS